MFITDPLLCHLWTQALCALVNGTVHRNGGLGLLDDEIVRWRPLGRPRA